MIKTLTLIVLAACFAGPAFAQQSKTKKKKPPQPFKWVNEKAGVTTPGVEHGTFRSPSMDCDVGYYIYLPKAYAEKSKARFPVVYYLHGGRPGSEAKSVKLANYIHAHQKTPVIYVFVNGGPVSHYNMPERENAMGEDVFIKELIPHIDATFRTIAHRRGRGLEGFSQGGRGTSRMMFKHPDLFCSAAPGGGGYETEKRISEEGGRESDSLIFSPGYNTWDLARAYAKHQKPSVRRLIFVGSKGFNYENNLDYMAFLEGLNIPFERLIVEGAPHSASIIYQKNGEQILQFHVDSFKAAAK